MAIDMQTFTPIFDAIKGEKIPGKGEMFARLVRVENHVKETDEARKIREEALRANLLQLDEAIKQLKAKPAPEDGSMEGFVKALLPFSADLLVNPAANPEWADRFKPAFKQFHGAYDGDYEPELKRLRETPNPSVAIQARIKDLTDLIEEKAILKNILDKNFGDENAYRQAMANFYLNVVAKRAFLLNPMVQALTAYRKENESAFDRLLENMANTAGNFVNMKGQHLFYAQGWELVGALLMYCFIIPTTEAVLLAAIGQKLPSVTPSNQNNNGMNNSSGVDNSNPMPVPGPDGRPRLMPNQMGSRYSAPAA